MICHWSKFKPYVNLYPMEEVKVKRYTFSPVLDVDVEKSCFILRRMTVNHDFSPSSFKFTRELASCKIFHI